MYGVPAPAQTPGDTVHAGKSTGIHTLTDACVCQTTQACSESLFSKVNVSLFFWKVSSWNEPAGAAVLLQTPGADPEAHAACD